MSLTGGSVFDDGHAKLDDKTCTLTIQLKIDQFVLLIQTSVHNVIRVRGDKNRRKKI